MGYAARISPGSYPIVLPTNTRGTPSITRKNHAMSAAAVGCGIVTPAILCGLGFGE